jgi:hypothetical protein
MTRFASLVRVPLWLALAAGCALSTRAFAAERSEVSTNPAPLAEPRLPAQSEAPVVALTHSARAPSQPGYGASAFGSGAFALSGEIRSELQLGGGLRIWGSPLRGFTLIGDAFRSETGELAPALTLQMRFWQDDRWAIGALGRFKSEGFAEIEGEFEAGLLGSYDAGAAHLDLNLVVGGDLDRDEKDGELSLRAGRDLFGFLRAGVEGRVRYRLSGDVLLPGGRTWDVVAGPELSASFDSFFASLLTGPTSVGVVSGVGWQSLLTFGGVR